MSVTISSCSGVLAEVCQLLEKSFGPNALQVMICTQTGQLLVTSDGMMILRSIHPSHPILRFILASVTSHHSFTGEGCKTFILTLRDMLQRIENRSELPVDTSDIHCNETRIKLAAVLHHIQYAIIPNHIIPKILQHATKLEIAANKKDVIIAEAKCLIHTGISSKESRLKASKLTDLTTDFIFNSSTNVENLKETLETLSDHFSYFCIDESGGQLLDSIIIPGILIDRNFVTTLPTKVENISYVILDCDFNIGNSIDTTSAIFQINSELNLTMAYTWKKRLMEKVLFKLHQKNVDVLLYTGKVCDAMKQLCNDHGIAVVQYLQKEDLDFITTATGISAIHDLRDILDETIDKTIDSHQDTENSLSEHMAYENIKFIGIAQSIKILTISGKQYVNLVPCLHHSSKIHPHTLVLYGPTKGLSKQYSTIVAGGVKTIQMWLQNIDNSETDLGDNPTSFNQTSRNPGECQEVFDKHLPTSECQTTIDSPNPQYDDLKDTVSQETVFSSANTDCSSSQNEAVYSSENSQPKEEILKVYSLPGGGAFEFLVHYHLMDYIAHISSNAGDCYLKTGCRIIAEGMLCVPRLLHRNSYSVKDTKNNFIKLQHLVMGSIGSNNLINLDGKTGEIQQLSENNTQVKESLYSKIHLLNNILTSVQQLLKIDRVVSVKSIGSKSGFINHQSDCEADASST